jgi:hypothetical protein
MPKVSNKEENMANFEEYKLLMEDTRAYVERRQTTTNSYLTTVNGGAVVLITLVGKDNGLNNWFSAILIVPLLIFGILTCMYWRQLIMKYKRIVSLRLNVLREMETKVPDSVQIYHREDELYPRDMQDRLIPIGLNMSDLEYRLPQIFIILYILMGLAFILGTVLVTSGVLPSPTMLPKP